MAYGGDSSERKTTANGKPWSPAGLVGTAAEVIGLLNKGSAKAPAAPSDVADLQPISSNSLNVTRVGGIGALISAAGGAALLLFNVNKTTDRASIVVAAYLSVGAIVAAALLTVAIIIAADIRARTAIATAVSPNAPAERPNVKRIQATQATVVPLDRTYDYVLVNAAAADTELVLPSAKSVPWQQMKIRREDNSNHVVTIRPQGQETIEGQQAYGHAQATEVQIYSDGQVWRLV
jgi:hypothetical protein